MDAAIFYPFGRVILSCLKTILLCLDNGSSVPLSNQRFCALLTMCQIMV
uniref:Uncharacterized protein n=1 Tax=Setaria viridis TaxID=4556 RepID=A0A4U6WAK1_SETVI|nr:hypothetical protein SEVIR_1G129833v2 [Setaria viridis]